MTSVLIICFLLLLAATAFAVRRCQHRAYSEVNFQLEPPAAHHRTLFSEPEAVGVRPLRATTTAAAAAHPFTSEQRTVLLGRAATGDLATLREAHHSLDAALYRDTLNRLIAHAEDSAVTMGALATHILDSGDLRANAQLAQWMMREWRHSPDRRTTAQMVHLAALSDDAATYQRAIELTLKMWSERKLPDLSGKLLSGLVESQYWVLTPEARRGGAGFVLKCVVSDVSRQLKNKRSAT